mmetsp:Transcript_100841/g.289849  ORF Transcript_100841/g.289849 Transcript_100841/m.289849 type:complete len:468 (-) Transcript_100841:1436-2839(-)
MGLAQARSVERRYRTRLPYVAQIWTNSNKWHAICCDECFHGILLGDTTAQVHGDAPRELGAAHYRSIHAFAEKLDLGGTEPWYERDHGHQVRRMAQPVRMYAAIADGFEQWEKQRASQAPPWNDVLKSVQPKFQQPIFAWQLVPQLAHFCQGILNLPGDAYSNALQSSLAIAVHTLFANSFHVSHHARYRWVRKEDLGLHPKWALFVSVLDQIGNVLFHPNGILAKDGQCDQGWPMHMQHCLEHFSVLSVLAFLDARVRLGVVTGHGVPVDEGAVVESGEHFSHVHRVAKSIDHGDDGILVLYFRSDDKHGTIALSDGSHLLPNLGILLEGIVLDAQLKRLGVIDVVVAIVLVAVVFVRHPWLHIDNIEQAFRGSAANGFFSAGRQPRAHLRPKHRIELVAQRAQEDALAGCVPLTGHDEDVSGACILRAAIFFQEEIQYGILDHEVIQCVEPEPHLGAYVQVLDLR